MATKNTISNAAQPTLMKTIKRVVAALAVTLCLPAPVMALEFMSVSVPAAVSYDSPSRNGKKLYIMRALTPVEVLVKISGFSKVRDTEGSIMWIASQELSTKRYVVVTADKGEIRQTANATAKVLAELDKWVALELIDGDNRQWAKVRHQDGVIGFVRTTQVWGL